MEHAATTNAVDTSPAFTWDDLHWNNPIRPTRRDLPQARVRFRILGVHRDGTVKTANLWTQPLDGEDYARARGCVCAYSSGGTATS